MSQMKYDREAVERAAAVSMQAQAEADETYQNRCVEGEKIFWSPSEKAYLPGQVYSLAGLDEFKISRCCEYHFDEWFKEEE